MKKKSSKKTLKTKLKKRKTGTVKRTKKKVVYNPDVFSSDSNFMPPFVPASYKGKKSEAVFALEKELAEGIKEMEREIALSSIKIPFKDNSVFASFTSKLSAHRVCIEKYCKEVSQDLSKKSVRLLNKYRKHLAVQSQKEVAVFANTKYPLSFKPFHVFQGLAVFAFFVALAGVLMPQPTINPNQLIQTAQTHQTSPIIAEGDSVKWSVLIKKSDITSEKKLVALPKNAQKIKVETISQREANIILAEETIIKYPADYLTLQDRKHLAGRFTVDLAGIDFRSTNTAGLLEAKEFVLRVLKALNTYLFADLEEAASNVIDQIVQSNTDTITETPTATIVDLSAEAEPTQAKEIKEEKKEEKENKKEETPSASDVIPANAGIQSEGADTNTNLDSPVQGNDSGETVNSDSGVLESAGTDQPATEATDSTVDQSTVLPAETTTEEVATTTPETTTDTEYVAVTYETPAPTITEQETSTGKIVTVSAPDEPAPETTTPAGSSDTFNPPSPEATAGEAVYTNVLAHTNIPEIYKVGQEDKIKLKWKSNGDQPMEFHAYDLNNNGKLDYVEWTVPHLSDQVFEIIFISKAWLLDSSKEITEDIYDQVKEQDNTWATVPSNNYVRVTFQATLTNNNDITVYAKPTESGTSVTIAVYATDTNQLVTTFDPITSEGTYKVILTTLQNSTDKFDLRISGGSLDIDYIVDPVGWLTGWSHRKKITIDNANVTADLTNFPTLVKITADADMATALATGYDVRFTDAGGTNLLAYETESWTGGAGASVSANLWVKVPTVATSADTAIYVYYGNSSSTTNWSTTTSTLTNCTTITNAQCVWKEGASQNYAGVWHLNETGTVATWADSTINNNDGTNNGATANSSGRIGGAGSFSGSMQSVSVGVSETLSTPTSMTISIWMKATAWSDDQGIVTRMYTWADAGRSDFLLYHRAPGSLFFGISPDGNANNTVWVVSSISVSDTNWHKVDAGYNGSAITIAVDGVSAGSTAYSGGVHWSGEPTYFGQLFGSGNDAYIFNGSLDEPRISSTARSADWMKFEYHNQADAGNNLTFATQENNLTWLAGWSYRKKITIDHTKVGATTEDQTNFPVLISLTGLSNINANGTDIRFTTQDGGTYLPREIESYSSGTLVAWVKVPVLSHDYDTSIYMYYGNSSATEPAVDSTYGKNAVWDANYKGVWHLNDPTSPTDSTSNANNGTNNGVTATTGKVGGAGSFDGTSDINAGHNSIFDSQTLTGSAWFKTGTANSMLFSNGGYSYGGYEFEVRPRPGGGGILYLEVMVGSAAGYEGTTGTTDITDNNWHYGVFTIQNNQVKLYLDGSSEENGSITGSPYYTGSSELAIGSRQDMGWPKFNGLIDNISISSTARSAGWISTEYANQNSPSTFYTVATTESNASDWLSGWSNRKKITIKHTQVDETLTNFPLLVKLTNTSDLSEALATGYDVRFTSSDGTTILSYERESWTGGAGTAVTANLWVKVPTITTAADTDLWLYYGNSSAPDGQDATAVWDSNFKGVWHMNDPTTPTDSTTNNNDGTNSGVTATTGKVGGAGSFDGASYIDVPVTYSANQTLTFSAWASLSAGNYPYILGAGYYDLKLRYFSGSAQPSIEGYNSSSGYVAATSSEAVDATWHMLNGVWDGSKLWIYVDGAIKNTNDLLSNEADYGGTFNIGREHQRADYYFTGTIDEVRISTSARSASWIKFEYANMNSADNELVIEGSSTTNGITWTNGSGDNKWSTAANWQGGVAPTTSDTAVFTSSATDNCTIDTNVNVKGINIVSGYTGTITQSSTYTVTVGTEGFTQAGGTFTGGSGDVTINGNYTLSGGTFTSTTGNLGIMGNWTHTTGSFVHNSGTVTFSSQALYADNNLTISSTETFNNLTVDEWGCTALNITSGKTVIVGGTLNLSVGYILGGTINAKDITIGTRWCAYSNSNINISGTLQLSGGETLTTGTITLGEGSTVEYTGTSGPYTLGNWSYYNLKINGAGGTFNLPANTTVNGNLTITNGTLDATTSNYNLTVNGSWTQTGGTFTPRAGTVTMAGGGEITATSAFNNLTINASTTVPSSNLKGWWKFDDATGTTATDSSGNSNTGTLTNGPTWTTGVSGGALSFDGVNDSVNYSDTNFPIGASASTLSMWFYPLQTAGGLFSWGSGTNNYSRLYGIKCTNKIGFGGWDSDYCSSATITVNKWYHLDAVYDGSSQKIYINGVLEDTHDNLVLNTILGEYHTTGDNVFGTGLFSGTIDDVRIYNTALTAAQVRALASGNEPGYTLSSNISIAGNFTNTAGTFDTATKTVTLNGTNQTIAGSTTFYNLTKQVTSADTLTFTAGTTQIIAGAITLSGVEGQLLSLRSSSEDTQWSINPQATRTLSYLDVKDSNNTNATIMDMAGTNSTDSGNNTNWQFDITAPVTAVNIVQDTSNQNNATLTLICTDGAGAGCATTYYCYGTEDTCTPTTLYATPFTISWTQVAYIRYYSIDLASNQASTSTHLINLTGGGGDRASSPTPTPVPVPVSPPQEQPTIITQIAEQIQNIVDTFNPGAQQTQINYPSIEESVPANAPIALQGWNIMEVKPLNELALTQVESDITFFADKIPQFKQTLIAFGIDVNNVNDVKKVIGAELYLPGLTQTVLTPAEILAINKFVEAPTPAPEVGGKTSEERKGLVAPGNLALNGFAAVQGVPLASLSPEARQKIPSDIVFARTGGELIDYSMAISVDKQGKVAQKIATVSGKPMELVVKPDQPASSVVGYMTLTKAQVGQADKPSVLGYMTKFLTASVVSSVDEKKATQNSSSENALLVDKFAYTETQPGIFIANISAPATEGEYEISTVIVPKDILLAPKETKMAVVVNPEGYVYSQTPDGRLRIQGASVTLYYLNSTTKEYEVWPADKFLQKNPIKTDETGKFSFLVPKGTYKLKVETGNYKTFESSPFEMKEDIAVNMNVELFRKSGLLGWLNWQGIIVALLIAVIILLFTIVIIFIKRSPARR